MPSPNKKTELFFALEKALSRLRESFSFPRDVPHRESTIQRFEYTFEMSWRLMGAILKDEMIEAEGVRNCIRGAAKLGLITDVKLWFEYADARNSTSHIYLDEVALRVFGVATSGFADSVENLLKIARGYL